MQKKTLGRFLAELRKEKGMTQKEIAEILNVSDKTVSHWERDETSPDISLLPIIADIFSITADELLRGERKNLTPIDNSFFSQTYPPYQMNEKSTLHLFGKFKTQAIISISITVLSLLIGTGIKELFAYFVYSGAANIFSTCIVLCGILVSVLCSVIFTTQFKNKISGTEQEKEYSFKAMRISTLCIYFSVLCFGVYLSFVGRHTFLYITITLLITVITELIIGKKLLNTQKAFSSTKNKKLYSLKRAFILVCAVLYIAGGFSHFFFSEMFHPTASCIVLNSAEEFKAYMETPKEKPSNSYLVDDVEMTVMFSEPDLSDNEDKAPVEDPETDVLYYGTNGEKLLKFRYLNKAVYDYTYNEGTNTFYIITYEAKIKTESIKDFCDITLGRIMPLYYVMVTALCLCVYRKKSKKITF